MNNNDKSEKMNYKTISIPKLLFWGIIGFIVGNVINRAMPEELVYLKYILLFTGLITLIFLLNAIKAIDKKIEKLIKSLNN